MFWVQGSLRVQVWRPILPLEQLCSGVHIVRSLVAQWYPPFFYGFLCTVTNPRKGALMNMVNGLLRFPQRSEPQPASQRFHYLANPIACQSVTLP